ncbi:protein NIM1-INTERACTING 3-like [Rosa sericea]
MEGDRKKRKMDYEEEDEAEKIEKFFALIKSTRQVCEILRGSSNWPLEKKDQNKKEEDREKRTGGAWNPAFQPEDFLDQDDKATSDGHGAGPSKIQEEDKEEEDKGGDGLDLKLSL